MSPNEAYEELKVRFKEVWTLASVSAALEWDRETYMPDNASDFRSEQESLLARMVHEKHTDPKIGELLDACEDSDLTFEKDSVSAVNIREWRRDYDKRTKLPSSLVAEIAKVTSKAQVAWSQARSKSDFSIFAPHLEKVLKLTLQKAEAYGFENEPYDALMDDFEPDAKVSDVEHAFAELRKELVELNGKIAEAPSKPDIGILKRPYDVDRQRMFSEIVAAAIGYDFNAGRIDEVTHPFCTELGPSDTRICTRFYPDDLAEGLTGTVHETGHALYDMGLPKEHYGTPMGDVHSLGLHESQSRMWENQVGRSREFWVYFFPQARRIFRNSMAGVSLDDFFAVMNYVSPSYIRVEADEATYNLHIMLRFEIERALLNGDIAVKDIPGEWNKRFKDYLGIEVDKDSNGCLQDVHWSMGAFGYFPTYALGNLYAGQFYAQANADLPGLGDDFANGDFGRLLNWLRDNIHRQARRYPAAELCQRVTGEPLSHKPLMDYLYGKYEGVYGIRQG
jgi:carboxypeptidase Taq